MINLLFSISGQLCAFKNISSNVVIPLQSLDIWRSLLLDDLGFVVVDIVRVIVLNLPHEDANTFCLG